MESAIILLVTITGLLVSVVLATISEHLVLRGVLHLACEERRRHSELVTRQ
jgi:hypothetical protein